MPFASATGFKSGVSREAGPPPLMSTPAGQALSVLGLAYFEAADIHYVYFMHMFHLVSYLSFNSNAFYRS